MPFGWWYDNLPYTLDDRDSLLPHPHIHHTRPAQFLRADLEAVLELAIMRECFVCDRRCADRSSDPPGRSACPMEASGAQPSCPTDISNAWLETGIGSSSSFSCCFFPVFFGLRLFQPRGFSFSAARFRVKTNTSQALTNASGSSSRRAHYKDTRLADAGSHLGNRYRRRLDRNLRPRASADCPSHQ